MLDSNHTPPRPINPLLTGFHPDPSVCRVDGPDGTWFYLVTSTFEYLPGLPIHRSRDLVDWELVGHAIHREGQLDLSSVGDSEGLFAPTIRHDGSRFLIVCTLVGKAARSGNFIVTAEDPAGPWSAPVWWEGGGIDPSLFADVDGSLWAQGTRLAPQPEWDQQTEVWVRRVDPLTLQLTGPEHVVWTGAVRGAVWTEGPHLYRRGDHVYLIASEGGTSIHHAVSVARAESPTGPFTGCKGNPIFTHRHLGRRYPIVNVGHADLVEDCEGRWWSVLLASRPVDGVDILGRETFLVPVTWEEGWPVMAPGVGTVVANPQHPDAPPLRPAPGCGPRSELVAVRRFPRQVADVVDGRISMRAGEPLGTAAPAYVGRRLRAVPSTLTVTLDSLPATASAGLAIRFDSRVWGEARVQPTADGVRLSILEGTGGGEPGLLRSEVVAPCPAHGTLRLAVDGLVATATWLCGDGHAHPIGDLSLAAMGACVSGGFVGATFGLQCVGSGVVVAHGLSDAPQPHAPPRAGVGEPTARVEVTA